MEKLEESETKVRLSIKGTIVTLSLTESFHNLLPLLLWKLLDFFKSST
jgi:hypothetical protein